MVYNKEITKEFPRSSNDNGFLSRPIMAHTQAGAQKQDFGADSQTDLKEFSFVCGAGSMDGALKAISSCKPLTIQNSKVSLLSQGTKTRNSSHCSYYTFM